MSSLFAAAFLLLGGVLSLLSAVGILRLPDPLLRMHAATKVGVLGTIVGSLAVALHFWDVGLTARCLAASFFILATTPVAAHLVARVIYESGVALYARSRDEFAEDEARAAEEGEGLRLFRD